MLSIHFDDESKLRLLNSQDRDLSHALGESTLAFIQKTSEFTEIVTKINSSLENKSKQVEQEKMHVLKRIIIFIKGYWITE